MIRESHFKNSRNQISRVVTSATRPVRGIWPRRAEAVLGLVALVVIAFAGLTYCTPLAEWTSRVPVNSKYAALAEGMLNPFRTPQMLMNSGLPVYDVSISPQEYALVEDAVHKAKQQGIMTTDLHVWARARLIYGGRNYNVKVRVRGDLPGHWSGPKKSWAIKFTNEEIQDSAGARKEPIHLEDEAYGDLSRRRINLIVPWDRDYAVAPFVNQFMREKGLLVPQDRFAVLRLNGVLQGLYYEVEQFDNPLLAANRRPETTIFGQNGRSMHFEQYTKHGTAVASDAKYEVVALDRAVDEVDDLGLRAMRVLLDHANKPTPESFRHARAVLDWNKYLQFRALTTLFNTNHVRFGSDNMMLYFDASRGLLEPVPWDVHLVRMPKEPGTVDFWNSHGPDELQRATLLDPQLRLQRNRTLWEMVRDGGTELMAKFNALHERIRPLAWADVLSTPVHAYKMDCLQADLQYNVRRVHKVLKLSNAGFTYKLAADDRAALEVAAASFSGIRLDTVELTDPANFAGEYRLYEDADDNDRLDDSDPLVAQCTAEKGKILFKLGRHVLPEVKYDGDFVDGQYWEYMDTLSGRARFFLVGKLTPPVRHPLDWTPPQIRVSATNAVTDLPIPSAVVGLEDAPPENSIGIVAYDASDPLDLDAPGRTLAEFLGAHPEFTASVARPGAAELSGKVALSGTVIVPTSVPLVLQPGADITLSPRTSLVAYGGLLAIGTAEQPIRIHGDGSGQPWGTFASVRSPEEVVFRYLEVQGGGQAQVNCTLFTGGVAVYQSNLRVEHCRITDMQSEDGLNLKYGQVFMDDFVCARNGGDGVDLDFVTGEVRNSRFEGNKNDGLDISGSKVTVTRCRFEGNGDKGLSVGENSHPILVDGLFRGNQIGVSCKDKSHPRIAHATFVDNVLAIEAKRKKPMFGGASGEFVNSVFAGNQTFIDQDYFSKDRVVLRGCLLDQPWDQATCVTIKPSFAAPQDGDYRLAAGQESLPGLILTQDEWASTGLASDALRQPGVSSVRWQTSE